MTFAQGRRVIRRYRRVGIALCVLSALLVTGAGTAAATWIGFKFI